MERDIRPEGAAERLKAAEQVRQWVDSRGPTRASAVLQLWGAIVLSIYFGVFLLAYSSTMAGSTTLLLFPVLIFSSVTSGARERFGIRGKPRGARLLPYAVVIAGVVVLFILNIVRIDYPWWLNILVPAAMFVVLAAGPLRRILGSAQTPTEDRWQSLPLSRPARITTGLLGVATGLLVASTSEPLLYSVVQLAVMLVLLVVLIGWNTRWGLPRTGFEWGPIHWAAFGVTMATLFAVAALLARTDWVTPPVSVGAGILVAAIMIIASLLPRHRAS